MVREEEVYVTSLVQFLVSLCLIAHENFSAVLCVCDITGACYALVFVIFFDITTTVMNTIYINFIYLICITSFNMFLQMISALDTCIVCLQIERKCFYVTRK